MLAPQERQVLLQALRPPEGYGVDRVVGTTYSLDLLALLTVPLAFTFFEWEDRDGQPTQDPLALLEAVRRHGKRITIFCQAGQIAVPPQVQLLLGYLESSVNEVTPPSETGVFHPKVWVLRFQAPDKPVVYRVLCLTRNLTFDRSWDVLLCLDGELTDRTNAYRANHTLADFVRDLPKLARTEPSTDARDTCELMQSELRRVRFELPEGIDEYAFWPLGMPESPKWPFRNRLDRVLVMSPFLSDDLLGRLIEDTPDSVLISNPEAFNTLSPDVFQRFKQCYAFAPREEESETEANEQGKIDNNTLSGLHAKLYVADAGWDARVWIGSANATNAAFSANVEFLVELRGKKSRLGIDALLAKGAGDASLLDLLQPVGMPTQAPVEDGKRKEFERQVEEARRGVVSSGLTARITSREDGRYNLEVRCGRPKSLASLEGLAASCWPISLPQQPWAVPLVPHAKARTLASFSALSFEALTAFIAFEIRAGDEQDATAVRFVLNLPVIGMPEGREERLLTSLLGDRNKLLRYLLFLLAEDNIDASAFGRDPRAGLAAQAGNGDMGAGGLPLFEAMVRALERDPQKLNQVARLVEDLKSTPEGCALLPKDFHPVWEAICKAQEELRHGA